MGSTLRTIPLSYRKIFRFCIFVTTNRTGLAACKKSIHSHKLFPLFLQFVSQKCCEHTPAVIWNGFSKFQRPWHCFHIQIFYTYAIIGIGYLSWPLMQKVFSLIRNLFVKFCHFNPLLIAMVRTFLHFWKLTLVLFSSYCRIFLSSQWLYSILTLSFPRKTACDTWPQAHDASIVRVLNMRYYLNLLYFNFYYLTKDIILWLERSIK